jgi:hypothetical protein
LFRAGVYLAALETNSPEPSGSQVLDALDNDLVGKDNVLLQFLSRHRDEIMREDSNADKRKMLRGILRLKAKAAGLLRGRAETEYDNTRKALERARRTEERLSAWKEGTIKVSVTPELVQIADVHARSFIDQSSE